MRSRIGQATLAFLMVVTMLSTSILGNQITAQAANKPAFNKTKVVVIKGKTTTLEVKYAPKGVSFTWLISNVKIAKISAGSKTKKVTIKGFNAGSTTIQCTLKNGKKIVSKIKVAIKVNNPVPTPIPTRPPTPKPTNTPSPIPTPTPTLSPTPTPSPTPELGPNLFGPAIGEEGDFSNLTEAQITNNLFLGFQKTPDGVTRAGGENYGTGNGKYWDIVHVPDEPEKRAFKVRTGYTTIEIVWICPPNIRYVLDFDYKGGGSCFYNIHAQSPSVSGNLVPTGTWKHFSVEFNSNNSYKVIGFTGSGSDIYLTNMKLRPILTPELKFDGKFNNFVLNNLPTPDTKTPDPNYVDDPNNYIKNGAFENATSTWKIPLKWIVVGRHYNDVDVFIDLANQDNHVMVFLGRLYYMKEMPSVTLYSQTGLPAGKYTFSFKVKNTNNPNSKTVLCFKYNQGSGDVIKDFVG